MPEVEPDVARDVHEPDVAEAGPRTRDDRPGDEEIVTPTRGDDEVPPVLQLELERLRERLGIALLPAWT